MTGFWSYILTAFALVFVIEGLIYALFPDTLRKMMAMALTLPVKQLRNFGALMAITGFLLVWILANWQSH